MFWRSFISGLALAFTPFVAFAEGRVALVIGNSDYEYVSYLPNAVNDARDVAHALKELGFDVIEGFDLTRSEVLRKAQEMQKRLQPDDVAIFYFSGHGVQIGSENFIIPVDANGDTAQAVSNISISLQAVLSEMEQRADRNIIILDACRNNPFEIRDVARSIGGERQGLAKVDAGVGSFIAFSTQPGNVALDGVGDNSPFTSALLRHLSAQQDDLHEVMRKVRRDVVEETESSQIPWENSSLIDRIYLGVPNGRITAPVSTLATEMAHSYRYQVAGLDPNGDGFLALRDGTTTSATRLAKMTEGTKLEFLGQNGVWFHVRTETGLQGWAHSNWIRFLGGTVVESADASSDTCESLWYDRNAIFARNGYCFGSARGQAAFSNEGCRHGIAASDIGLSIAEINAVSLLVQREKSLNCR